VSGNLAHVRNSPFSVVLGESRTYSKIFVRDCVCQFLFESKWCAKIKFGVARNGQMREKRIVCANQQNVFCRNQVLKVRYTHLVSEIPVSRFKKPVSQVRYTHFVSEIPVSRLKKPVSQVRYTRTRLLAHEIYFWHTKNNFKKFSTKNLAHQF